MKRYFMMVLAGMLLVAGPISAQTIGFKLGGTYSTISLDDEESEADWMSAFGGGGFIRFGFGGLSLQVDVLALTKGAEIVDVDEGDLNVNLEYIDVPVQAVFSLGGNSLSPYLMVGPSFGFELDCELEAEVDDEDDETVDCAEGGFFGGERKSFDIGITGALGLQIPLGPGALLFEGRYTHGLTDLIDHNVETEDFSLKNRSFGFFAGYSIPLGN